MEIQERSGLLVERFSWKLETTEEVYAGSDQFEQLRADFIETRKSRSREIELEMRMIEAYFSGKRPEDEARFDQTRQELMDAMKRFQSLVPVELRTTEIPKSWLDVKLAISTVQAQWEAKSKESHAARARHWVRKMCTGLNNHSAALEMLPRQNDYVSLVAGAVTMIIKASANYAEITESFAKGVSEINDAVAIVQKSHIYDTQPIQQLVMRLYTCVFSYLHKFMAWYTSRSRSRFLKSFNENIQQIFEDDLQQIRDISIQLSQQIQLYMAADVRVSKLVAEDTNWAVRYLVKLAESDMTQKKAQQEIGESLLQNMFLEQFNKSLEEMRESSRQMMLEYNERIRQSISGIAITELLTIQAERDMEIPDAMGIPHLSPSPTPSKHRLSFTTPSDNTADNVEIPYQAADIKFLSRLLDSYCNWEHVFPIFEHAQQLYGHPFFVSGLSAFTENMSSQILYTFGRYRPEQANFLRLSAAQYISLARQHGIPAISYFCGLSAEAPPPGRTRESVELSSLLYSLIRQAVDLFPAEFTTTSLDLTEERFATLDGTLRTWRQAINLFTDLVKCLQLPLLLFVLDGLNLLEDDFERSTSAKVGELVRALVWLVDGPGGGKKGLGIVKVLFTSAGPSTELCRELDSGRVVACGEANSPPTPRTGRQFFL